MATPGGSRGAMAERIALLTAEERRSLGVLAVVAPGSLAIGEVARLAELPSAVRALTDLKRQALVRRDADDRWSLAPESASQLKQLLAGIDTTDRVLRGFIGIAEDGQLTLSDLDAVVELTRIAAEKGRWAELLRLAEAAETTLSTTRRVEEWVKIVERRREAARALGDTAATARAEGELARLADEAAARSRSGGAPPRAGVRWPLVAAAAVVVGAVGVGAGYLVADGGSDGNGGGPVGAAQTVTDTVTDEVTTPGQTVTETQTETVTVTTTVTTTETTPTVTGEP